MYNFNDVEDGKDVLYLDAGIHDDVELVKAELKATPNNNKYVELTFKKNGQILTVSRYEPKVFQGDKKTIEEKSKTLGSWFVQILECWHPKEVVRSFKGTTFDEMSRFVLGLVATADKSKLVRLKVVYKGIYSDLPQYANYTFIERMDVETSKIKKLLADKFTRAETDAEPQRENPVEDKSADADANPMGTQSYDNAA